MQLIKILLKELEFVEEVAWPPIYCWHKTLDEGIRTLFYCTRCSFFTEGRMFADVSDGNYKMSMASP